MQPQKLAISAAALGLAALGALAATASTGDPKATHPIHLWLDQPGDHLAIDDLGDLAPGASRDYTTESGKRVTVTREAHGFSIDVDGKKVRLGEPAGDAVAPGGRIDRLERIEIGEHGAKNFVIALGDGELPGENAPGRHVRLIRPGDGLPAASGVEDLVAGLEKSAKFQALDDATQQMVRDIVRDAAPAMPRWQRIEVRRLPGDAELRLEDDGDAPPEE